MDVWEETGCLPAGVTSNAMRQKSSSKPVHLCDEPLSRSILYNRDAVPVLLHSRLEAAQLFTSGP